MKRGYRLVPAAVLAMLSSATLTRADQVFVERCAVCHQADAMGVPGIYPQLAGTIGEYLHARDGRSYLIHLLLAGMSGDIESGSNDYDGDMPSWWRLNDQDIADTLNYVLTTFNAKLLPANFQPISAAEVARARRDSETADQVYLERAAVMKDLGDKR